MSIHHISRIRPSSLKVGEVTPIAVPRGTPQQFHVVIADPASGNIIHSQDTIAGHRELIAQYVDELNEAERKHFADAAGAANQVSAGSVVG